MDLDDVFTKTQDGIDALFDPRAPLSPAFKRLLTAVDGRLSLNDLLARFPHLTTGDIKIWASELGRMRYIEPVARFEPTPVNSFVYDGYVEMTADPEFKAVAGEVSQWMKANSQAGKRTEANLANTTQMAVIEAASTINTINRSGFFMNLAEIAQSPVQKRNVLIIEDDDMQVMILKKIIGQEGHDIKVAQNKAEALAALNSQPSPDLLLLDVELPDTDGFTILEKVKQHPVLKKCRVVMVTARTDRADIAKGVLLGADGYITKPYRPETLKAAVRQALGQV